MSKYLIAVYDIGKTNKKFIVFNEDLKPCYKKTAKIGEIVRNGILCDDVERIIKWMHDTLKEEYKGIKVRSLAITTFGATGALLDDKGELVIPVVSYNQEISNDIRDRFYRTFGSPEDLYMRTGTPPYGQLLNFGVQLFWIRTIMPEVYNKTKTILFLPQYLSYVITGVKTIEITSVGCHTYLYDILDKDWSDVARGLEVDSKTPSEFEDVWEAIGCAKWIRNAVVTTGIHDSNASLLPFLLTRGKEDFVLASTGTWCVFMYPHARFQPKRDDLYKDVLYYIDAFGRPTRASRFKGGYEFDYYVSMIKSMFNPPQGFLDMDVDIAILKDILRGKKSFIVPTLTPGSGQFPKSKGRIIGKDVFSRNLKTAYHLLCLSIAIQTYFALEAVLGGIKRGVKVIVVGGFAKNRMYMKILATLLRYHDIKVLKTEYEDLTSLGTAITAKMAYEGIKPKDVEKELIEEAIREVYIKPIEDIDERDLMEYVDIFKEHCLRSE